MKSSITLINVVLDVVEKIFLRSLPNCAAGSAFFCQVWRSIKQPDGGRAVTGDDDFHKCSEGLSPSVASRQFLTPDTGKIVLHGDPRRLAHLAQNDVSCWAQSGDPGMSALTPLLGAKLT